MFAHLLYKVIYPNIRFGKAPRVERGCKFFSHPNQNKKKCVTRIGDDCLIRSGTKIYWGNNFGDRFVTGNNVNIRENNNFGDDVSIGTSSIIEHSVVIGDNVRIHSGVFVPECSIIKDYAWIGPRVVITNSKYPARPDSKQKMEGVVISKSAVIGANATLLPGVLIGEGSLIGAGSVVTKDVPDYCIVAGNPAEVRRRIKHEG